MTPLSQEYFASNPLKYPPKIIFYTESQVQISRATDNHTVIKLPAAQ